MAKTSKPGKSNKKVATGGMVVTVVAIVLIIACFFTYISGILPKLITGISITETLPDGSTGTVRNFSILEANFHFQETFGSYSQYGYVTKDNLEDVYDSTTGETYREWLLRETANQLKTLTLVQRSAEQSEFYQYSKAKEIAAKNMETMDLNAMMYGYQSGQHFLTTNYGTGMTKRAYADFSADEILVQEYGSYLKQFDPTIVPSDEEVQAKYEENPNQTFVISYSSYFIQADKDDSGNVVDFDKTVAAGKKIADAAKDTASFRTAVMDYLKDKGDEEALAGYEEDADPTYTENMTYSNATYMSSEVKDFLFSDCKIGDVKVIETEFGVYVVRIADKKANEIKNVTYRMLTLSTGAKSDATAEEIAAALQETKTKAESLCTAGMAPIAFYSVVKNNSQDTNEILEGGYNAAVTVDAFISTEENPLDSATIEAGQWLFDGTRQCGDVKIIASEDQKTVYVYYFEASRPAWEVAIRNDMITANFNAWNVALEQSNPGYVVNSGLMKYLIY